MNSAYLSTCKLTKHHALGNDFLVLDLGQFATDPDIATHSTLDWPALARTWCDRRTGIGADGLLLLRVLDRSRLTMRLYNADGGLAEMSGNGIRCLAQAAYRKLSLDGASDEEANGMTRLRRFDVETDAGRRVVELVDTMEGRRPELAQPTNDMTASNTMHFSVDMGIIEDLVAPDNWAELGCHEDRPVRHVSLGNPHSVVGVDDVDAVDLGVLGAKVPTVNLEIVEPGPETNAVTMRVHERGAGLTMACGTGACAAAEAALAWGLVPASASDVIVHMPGGDVTVAIDPVTRRATLTGPTTFVAEVLSAPVMSSGSNRPNVPT